MSTLTITRGLPGSGKTTWAKAQPGAVRVNRDELRLMLHGGRVGTGTAEVQVTRASRAAIEALLRAGTDVICDDTNLRARVVRELAELAASAGAGVVVEDFTGVPVEVCVERDAGRPEPVGEAVIRGMHQRYLAGKRGPLTLMEPQAVAVYTPDPTKPSAIMVDLDGTVAIIGDRSPYDAHRAHVDLPNTPVITAVRAMHAAGHVVIYCSGRTDDSRAVTEKWLAEHVGVPYEALHMRATGDTRKDSIVKTEFFNERIRDHYQVVAVFDDRNQVVRAWRDLGLTVFQVAEGNF
ncbi:putative kinase [Allocatelliglobosispora scoriae]|uniref:Putative kinase n=1 Tax=Allocatelliglobosispora scoriae TaxID=643052 RepID=A0A841BUZ8_9ACTN|nr:AAA family ATPase [Allocatelliglobosispora scoriae]MBB5872024.1 putative kinase [Allocatelliglobosispora scoriae]